MNSIDILEKLVAFPTISQTGNLQLLHFVGELLSAHDIAYDLVYSDDKQSANLFATIGPRDKAGLILSGHSDVVPVAGQSWTKEPFRLSHAQGKYYGRGTADMKGFLASAIAQFIDASQYSLSIPIHLAISYDEEVGCVGVRGLLEWLKQQQLQPAFCLIGEPTSLKIATGHKGKTAAKIVFHGQEGHSALAPFALNAIHLASDFIADVRELQKTIARDHPQDTDYEVPYTTLHIGKISGGTQLNIVPNMASLEFEIRHLASDDPAMILQQLQTRADAIIRPYQDEFPQARIEMDVTNSYPGLDIAKNHDVIEIITAITAQNHVIKVPFGTEGGLFHECFDVPTIICGPGSMAQGHKADEFITETQMQKCDDMLAQLCRHFAA